MSTAIRSRSGSTEEVQPLINNNARCSIKKVAKWIPAVGALGAAGVTIGVAIPLETRHSIVALVSSGSTGILTQASLQLLLARENRNLVNSLLSENAYLVFEVVWNLFYNLSQTKRFETYATFASLVSNGCFLPLTTYATNTITGETIEAVRKFIKRVNKLDFSPIDNLRRAREGLALLGPKTSSKEYQYLLEVIVLAAGITGFVTSHTKEGKWFWLECVSLFTATWPIGYFIKDRFGELFQERYERDYEASVIPDMGEGLAKIPLRLRICHGISDFAALFFRAFGAIALSTNTPVGYGISGALIGVTHQTQQRNFEVIRLRPKNDDPNEAETIELRTTLERSQAKVQKRDKAKRIAQVTNYFTAFFFLLGSLIFWSITAITSHSDDRTKSGATDVIATSLATVGGMLFALSFHKLIGKSWAEGTRNRLTNTAYFVTRYFPDPIPLSAIMMSMLNNLSDSSEGKSKLSTAMDITGWLTIGISAGLILGRITGTQREWPARMSAIAIMVYAVFLYKFTNLITAGRT